MLAIQWRQGITSFDTVHLLSLVCVCAVYVIDGHFPNAVPFDAWVGRVRKRPCGRLECQEFLVGRLRDSVGKQRGACNLCPGCWTDRRRRDGWKRDKVETGAQEKGGGGVENERGLH